MRSTIISILMAEWPTWDTATRSLMQALDRLSIARA